MHRLPISRARKLLHAVQRWIRPQPTVTIAVFLNNDPRALLDGYSPGAQLVLAYRYTLPAATAGTDPLLLERVFAAFNDHPVHPSDQPHAEAWIAKRLRSLSVGDVVALDDRYYACASVGWTSIPAPGV
ncbi:hypothetical protein ACFYT3_31300 [Nocardia amikacinitolerans]|uniref:hypothetical protein n=1 Tax=Nocardia amikacinitolerans TaxID=756689 RepID=UPI0036782CE6